MNIKIILYGINALRETDPGRMMGPKGELDPIIREDFSEEVALCRDLSDKKKK